MPHLELKGVRAFYGSLPALHGVDLFVEVGELVCLLGANGSGKSTLLRAVSQMVRTEGQILFEGRSLSGLSPDAVARLGIAHVPEGRGTFTDLTVWENLILAARARPSRLRASIAEDLDLVFTRFPILREFRRRPAGSMSGGQQQMLAIARGLLVRPSLLLIDEPSLGLAPKLVQDLFAQLARLREDWNLAVLLAEQNAAMALGIGNRAYVLESGVIRVSGSATELRSDLSVLGAYLGV
jgi:branched-chain amino acid transport system ATP-binding protein